MIVFLIFMTLQIVLRVFQLLISTYIEQKQVKKFNQKEFELTRKYGFSSGMRILPETKEIVRVEKFQENNNKIFILYKALRDF